MGVYERLGVRRVINARGSVSLLGGTHMRTEVREAIEEARRYHVSVVELQARIHERLAELTRNEAAAVTNGCASAIAYAVWACMVRSDPRGVYPLPDAAELQRREIIVQRSQYTPYIVNVRQTGAQIVEVGDILGTSPDELRSAIGTATAGILYSAGDVYEKHALPLVEVISIAQEMGVPVIVDAAELLPPPQNLWRFTHMGADVVAFSGGKGLRGPQDSGLLVGCQALLGVVHEMLSPRHGIARSMKMAKEDMVGLLRAVECMLSDDQEAETQELYARAQRICASVAGLPGIETWVVPTARYGQPLPRAVIRLGKDARIERERLLRELADREPSIELGRMDEDPSALYVNPFYLTLEEESWVLEALINTLTGR